MSNTRKSPLIVPVVQAATGALEGALSGAIGSGVLNAAKYNFDTASQAAAGAVGGAILGAANGLLETVGFFKRSVHMKSHWTDRIVSPFSTVGFNVLAGMLGGAILKSAENTDWQTATIALAVGATLVYVPKLLASELHHHHTEDDSILAAGESLLPNNNTYYRLSAS